MKKNRIIKERNSKKCVKIIENSLKGKEGGGKGTMDGGRKGFPISYIWADLRGKWGREEGGKGGGWHIRRVKS